MRIWLAAPGLLLLLALLTLLLLRGVADAPAWEMALKAFDDFALAEASLQRDVVQARAGLLRNYDGLVKAGETIRDAVRRLRHYGESERLEAEVVERLAAVVAQQEDLTERFKSNNALLQNSLTYLGLLSTGPAFGTEESRLGPATGAITAALLNLRRDTSPEAVGALQERIDRFAAQVPAAGPDAEAAQALLAHARLLHDVLPATDAALKAFFDLPGQAALQNARALFAGHHAMVEQRVQRSRVLLYLASILFLILLVNLGLLLRRRAVALRRRAAFEHVIARNSTRLINCPPDQTAARLQQVLGELGSAIAFDRVYVVLDQNPIRIHGWSAEGVAYAPGWPDQVLGLSQRLGATGPDVITIPNAGALASGKLKETLLAADVCGWLCVPLILSGGVRGVMGFDALGALPPAWEEILPPPVLRLAGDAVSSAIEREVLEHDRAKLGARLERARRMQIIGSLASGIAHNFNNIIAAILGFSEMVEPQLTPGSRPAVHIDEIRRAAERGRDLVDNILTFGRRRDARVRPLQVRALFEEAAALLRASLPEGIELVIDDVVPAAVVSGEMAQLQQVVLNLCTNASEAMQGAGRIRVSAGQTELQASLSLSHGELGPGRYVWLAVDDAGCGFDEAVAQRLFEPFFTTRLAGTGLGLATVREIVRDHDGAIHAQSRAGEGSRFEIWLPAAEPTGADVAPAVLPLGQGQTVMIVEGEQDRLLRDEEMLAALGYEPVGFRRSSDALAAYREMPARFDFILVSHAPKIQSGLDLVRKLHEIAPRQPLILATASANEPGVAALTEAGISEVLRRPLSSTELAAALARWKPNAGEPRYGAIK